MPDPLAGAGSRITKSQSIRIEGDVASEAAAIRYLKDPNRSDQPWALCVGFIAPHFPFVVPEPYFSMYYPENVDLPNIPNGHIDNLPPAAKRLREAFGIYQHSTDEILRARAAYYGQITWMDEKIGNLIDTIDEQGLSENTVVVYTSDHGESLGEHGLWRKNTFYEQASRVPLQIKWPSTITGSQRIKELVSLVDLTHTILELAGLSEEERNTWAMDGNSLMPLIEGTSKNWENKVFCEYEGHGTDRARAMIRSDQWKLSYGHGHPPELELYNLDTDPGEFINLSDDPAYLDVREELLNHLLSNWDPDQITESVIKSQNARHIIKAQNSNADKNLTGL